MIDTFSFLGLLFGLISQWWFWVPVAVVLGYMTWQNYRKTKAVSSDDSVLLLLEIPRANDKKELAAEQMFASLHGILRSKKELRLEGRLQEHVSFEIAAIGKRLKFYVWVPKHLQNFVEGQIYAQYPTVQIYEVPEDYTARDIKQQVVHTTELTLKENEVLPINTFQNFEVDPLAAITATLSKLEDDDEELWIQILARPIDDAWHKKANSYASQVKSGTGMFITKTGLLSYFGQMFGALWRPPEESSTTTVKELSERDKSRITAVEEKSRKLGYKVRIRIVYLGPDKATARLRMQAMVGTFKQFNTTNLNGFVQSSRSYSRDKLAEYRARFFLKGGGILNIEELASVYHLPHTSVETPNIVWATAKTAEPPPNLPAVGTLPDKEISPFGTTNFRGSNIQFGARRSDRGRHMYIIGQTGVGKSGLLELLTLSDIYHNEGFGVIDPHGDYAASVIKYVPAHRADDVVYFNPADREFPIGFNPLEVTDPNLKNHISSELVGVLKRMFESWGPRLEYILRYTILALLDYPDSTMLDITRMLTEKEYRAKVVDNVEDPVVKNFWINEFGSWNEKFMTEAVAPVLNKVGAFTANPLVRNIVGQPKSSFNIRKIMDEGKILIVNLSRGQVGEDNAAILGAMMVTKIQLAAMSRADIGEIEQRRPFYLYVDEFQNFATDSFAVILSEARKYGLNLTIANQFISQMAPEVKDAVFGNVGSIISFRVGADDASPLQKYFEPQFDSQDLIQLHNRNLLAAMTIGGEKTPAFSATTLNIPPPQNDLTQQIIANSRKLYATPKEVVEKSIVLASVTHSKASKHPASHTKQKPNGQKHSRSGSKGKSKKITNKSNHDKKQPSTKQKKNGAIKEDEIIRLR